MQFTCDNLDQASEVFAAINDRYSRTEPNTPQRETMIEAMLAAHRELARHREGNES